MSLAKTLSVSTVPPPLVAKLRALRSESAKAGLRLEVKWKATKPKSDELTQEQQEIVEWLGERLRLRGKAPTILDASVAFDTGIQAMGNRLARLVSRGAVERLQGRPARYRPSGAS